MLPRHLVVGAGEVGVALHKVLVTSTTFETSIRDVESIQERAHVLHICFPYSDSFVEDVQEYEKAHHASLVVVHSTVPVGTCDPRGWVHSPVKGMHPDLVRSLRTFTKHVGGARASEVSAILGTVGIQTLEHGRAAETEAGKLWELIQFGIQVRVTQEIYTWCEEQGLCADQVYRDFAGTYNEGYELMSMSKYLRPILDYVPGPIGGHCVTECSRFVEHELSRIVREGFGDHS